MLINGVACRAGAILTTGASWGDIALSVPRLRDTRQARALTFCEIVVLSRAALVKTMAKYPASARLIRQAALKLATRRMFILIAMYGKLHQSPPRPEVAATRLTPRSAIEAKALGLVGSGATGRSSPSKKAAQSPVPHIVPLSPSAALRALQSHGAVHGPSSWREPQPSRNVRRGRKSRMLFERFTPPHCHTPYSAPTVAKLATMPRSRLWPHALKYSVRLRHRWTTLRPVRCWLSVAA